MDITREQADEMVERRHQEILDIEDKAENYRQKAEEKVVQLRDEISILEELGRDLPKRQPGVFDEKPKEDFKPYTDEEMAEVSAV